VVEGDEDDDEHEIPSYYKKNFNGTSTEGLNMTVPAGLKPMTSTLLRK